MGEKIILFAAPGRVAEPTIKRLKDKGWISYISFRENGSSETEVKRLIETYGQNTVYGIQANISDPAEAEKFVHESLSKHKEIDQLALVNVASRFPPKDAFERWEYDQLQEDDWKYFSSNFGVMQNVTQSILKWYNQYVEQSKDKSQSIPELDIISFGDGRSRRYFDDKIIHPFKGLGKKVIDISTEDAKDFGLGLLSKLEANGRDYNPYMLSKLLIMYATRELALDYPGGKVNINAIAPGIMEPSPNDSMEAAQEFAKEASILQRIGRVSSAADKIHHLLEDNDYATGEIFPIDGGQYLKWQSQKDIK